jgi:hypothetical protein
MRPTLATVALLALLAGCSGDDGGGPGGTPTEPGASTGSSSTPSPTATPAPEPPAPPAEAACYRLTYAAALAPTSSASDVPCAGEHTAQTFHVGRLDQVVDGRLLAVDARRVQEQVATTCPDLLSDHVGGTEEQQRLSMLRPVWFTPTLKQSDAGADWFRCDAIAVAGESRLLPLTGPLRGVLAYEAGRARYGMCATAQPGTTGFERVACAEPHTWLALRTVPLPGPGYPGAAAAQRAGEAPCRAAGRARAQDSLSFEWGYEWPTEEQWETGQTYGICWAPDS